MIAHFILLVKSPTVLCAFAFTTRHFAAHSTRALLVQPANHFVNRRTFRRWAQAWILPPLTMPVKSTIRCSHYSFCFNRFACALQSPPLTTGLTFLPRPVQPHFLVPGTSAECITACSRRQIHQPLVSLDNLPLRLCRLFARPHWVGLPLMPPATTSSNQRSQAGLLILPNRPKPVKLSPLPFHLSFSPAPSLE